MRDVREAKVRELGLNSLHELLADLVLEIEFLVVVALLHSSIPSNGAHVDHAIPELHEGTSLDRNVQIRNIVQDETNKLLVVFFANVLDEAVAREGHSHADGGQAVLGEAVVEEGCDGDAGSSELLLLLCEVGAADEADGDFVAEGGEELEHFRGDGLDKGILVRGVCLGCATIAAAAGQRGCSLVWRA